MFQKPVESCYSYLMDIVKAVVENKARFVWAPVKSTYKGHELTIFVFRDALKVDGVREMATAYELQQIADLLDCSLLTPKVVDLIWEQATLRFESIVTADGDIAANSTSKRISELIDKEIEELGGDHGQLIDSVGKYWVLTNQLLLPKPVRIYGERNACNYGWPSFKYGKVSEVTPKIGGKTHRVWQNLGFQHADNHEDPSQTVRLMYKLGMLKRVRASQSEPILLLDVMKSSELAPLISHEGVLNYRRQRAVPIPKGLVVLTQYGTPFDNA